MPSAIGQLEMAEMVKGLDKSSRKEHLHHSLLGKV